MQTQNVPEFTVTEISGAVKQTLETRFGRVRVRGEITELKRYPSGHVYLSLKDAGGKLAAVVWRSGVSRLGLAPENGIEVVATGRITAYGERSSYQLVVERMEFAGAGALLAAIEQLRLRLAAEGLFEPGRRRALPLLPGTVGVVTSPSGAVLHDILTTVARRFARPVLLWPVPVQGSDAAARIAAAIEGFGRLPAARDPARPELAIRPDVLIVARGGGSLEDLMAFNDERVVRAAGACPIPLISAVGHETDTTLIDFASDRRAPTPTAAAELAVPVRSELLADLAHRASRLAGGLARTSHASRTRLDRAAAALPDLPALLDQARLRLDDRSHRLSLALPNLLAARAAALRHAGRLPPPRGLIAERGATLATWRDRLPAAAASLLRARGHAVSGLGLPPPHGLIAARGATLAAWRGRLPGAVAALLRARGHAAAVLGLPPPRAAIAARRDRLAYAQAGARRAIEAALRDGRRHARAAAPRAPPLQAALRERRARLDGLAARLDSVSYERVLARGYALVRDAAGAPIAGIEAARPGARVRIRFADGEIGARLDPARPDGQRDLML